MIGILVKTNLLDGFTSYVYKNFDEEPVDWLYGHYLLSQNKTIYWLHNIIRHEGRASTKDFVLRHERKKTTAEEAAKIPTWEQCPKL